MSTDHFTFKTEDLRTTQAKRFWDIGVGLELGKPSFETYLATIPEIPDHLREHDPYFPLLVLVDPSVGEESLCRLGGISRFIDHRKDFGLSHVERDRGHRELARPTWIRIQDGRWNTHKSVRDCWDHFSWTGQKGLTVLQGVCAYLHHPQVTRGSHAMDLAGSVINSNPDCSASLAFGSRRAEIVPRPVNVACEGCGSASRRVSGSDRM